MAFVRPLKLTVVKTLAEEIWRAFLQQTPHANIFHTPEMFQVFAQANHYRPHLWAVQDEQSQILALMLPVEVSLSEGLTRWLTTRAVAYGGVAYQPSPSGVEALDYLLQTYIAQTGSLALFTELRHVSDAAEVQASLQQHRFIYEDHLNILVSLAEGPDTILQNIRQRTRKQIRQALRQGQVVIEELTQFEQLPLWYNLIERTYNAANVPLAPPSLFEAAFAILQPRGMVKFLLARVGLTYVAASAELLYKDVIYGWYGGTDRNFAKYYPTELLLWHIFEWGATHGYRVYDFGGAGSPTEDYGVRDFKLKFGGELVCYGRNTYVHAPYRLKLSKWGYMLYRRLMPLAQRLRHSSDWVATGKGLNDQLETKSS